MHVVQANLWLKPRSNEDASWCELANKSLHGLAWLLGQTRTRVACESMRVDRKLTRKTLRNLSTTLMQLSWPVKRAKTFVDLHQNLRQLEVDASWCKLIRVDASWCKLMRVGGQTQARLVTRISLHQLASSFDRGFKRITIFIQKCIKLHLFEKNTSFINSFITHDGKNQAECHIFFGGGHFFVHPLYNEYIFVILLILSHELLWLWAPLVMQIHYKESKSHAQWLQLVEDGLSLFSCQSQFHRYFLRYRIFWTFAEPLQTSFHRWWIPHFESRQNTLKHTRLEP